MSQEVSEVFDVMGKMGLLMIELIRGLNRDKNKQQYNDVVKNMTKKHFGTGEVPYSRMLKREGLDNLDFSVLPAEKLDQFQQIAKQVGLPFSIVSCEQDPQTGKEVAFVAYSKDHAAAFQQANALLGMRQATPEEKDHAHENAKDFNNMEDAYANGQTMPDGRNPADIILFSLKDEQDFQETVSGLQHAGVSVFQARQDMPPDFFQNNPGMENCIGVLRQDFAKTFEVLNEKGIVPSTDAIVVPQKSTYKPYFETVRQQQAYEKQRSSMEHAEPAHEQATMHSQATNLTPQQVDALRAQFAAQDIPFVLSTGSSGLSDILVNDAHLGRAAAALAAVAPDRQFQSVPEDTLERAWKPGREADIDRMDLQAMSTPQPTMQQMGAPQVQSQGVVPEYMHPGDPALEPFEAGKGNLGPLDWSMLTKSDQEVEIVPIDGANFGTFVQTVGAEAEYAASAASNGQFAIAFDSANRDAVMRAVDQAQPGLHPVRLMPEEHQMDPAKVQLSTIKEQNVEANWDGQAPIRGTQTMPQMAQRSEGKMRTYLTSVDHAEAIAQQLQGKPFMVTPGQNGTAFITFAEKDAAAVVEKAPVLAKAKAVQTMAPAHAPKDMVNSGRSLMERAKRPQQKNAPAFAKKVQQQAGKAVTQAGQKIAKTVKEIAGKAAGTGGRER